MSSSMPAAAVLPPVADPHRESRERAERLLASVERELRANPSHASHAAHAATSVPSLSFIHGLRA
ncbi:MAG: hypothetical protein IPG17_04085 [Sandaracinaceae bacterium]|jgi:hypothetical protein|nr:hypothetical protein [Sandaracinaceae bacterium]MBK6807347.1 hypothetical protein [Sandaracinaceae bacterium]MBK7152145.1 hypothetical protein [Sandaracinaceae bacterium]MBK8410917.1 hypothetical protein [Sandaracinaceae bacterium]MBK8587845.1 hypothetical protein [Sandaracinaceae bacterium]